MKKTAWKIGTGTLVAIALMCGCAAPLAGKTEDKIQMGGEISKGKDEASDGQQTPQMEALRPLPDVAAVKAQTARYAPVPIQVDLSELSLGDRAALKPMILAAKVLDRLFLRQMWTGNEELLERLEKAAASESATEADRTMLDAFLVNSGPWSELDGFQAFISSVPSRKPKGAAYYPEGVSPESLEAFFQSLPEGERQVAKGFYSVIEKTSAGGLAVVPYSVAYRGELEEASRLLKEAATLADDPTLKRFLNLRAEAFLTDDYRPSEVAWMELKGDIDPTMGPYETYVDEAMGLKAAFEVYIGLRDHAESQRLAVLSTHLGQVEASLPMPDIYKRKELGALAPIAVLNQLFNAGDAHHGVQAAAFNLPNDEVVVAEKGSKRVMLKNVQQAKFQAILEPIADRVLEPSLREKVNFDAFFLHILAHELSHGLGPQVLTKDGVTTSVRHELGDVYSAIEEAKADLMGLFMVQLFIDGGQQMGLSEMFPKSLEEKLYVTYLASSFRTLRFGLEEAHARSMAVQMNAFHQKGAISVTSDGRFSVFPQKMREAVEALLSELLTIQATGDRTKARRLLDERAVLTPSMKQALDTLQNLPVDIRPTFVTADEITSEN